MQSVVHYPKVGNWGINHMKKIFGTIAAVGLAMTAMPAAAATVVQGFSVASGGWFGGGNPYGVGTNPAILGSVTVDTTNTTGTSFSAINWVTGSKIWTLADINIGASSVSFSGGNVSQFSLIFNQSSNYVYSSNTVAISDGRSLIACNGCVSLVAAQAAVPEPATWAMMLFGFGAIGGFLRRRRRYNTAAMA